MARPNLARFRLVISNRFPSRQPEDRPNHQDGAVSLNPPTQYTTEDNLRARQRLWEAQEPKFDLIGWVLDVAGFDPEADHRVLDVGCGNGSYLTELRRRGIVARGCDLSFGMLDAARPHPGLINGDVGALPIRSASSDLVLAPHMLYHVDDREQAAAELRRVTAPDGRCVVVTNGVNHMRSLRSLLETAVGRATAGWEMRSPSTHVFSLENGADPLRSAFDNVQLTRPAAGPNVSITDASIAAGYIASIADHYQDETTRSWSDVVDDVRASVQHEIDTVGSFTVNGETGAFICR